MSTHIQTDTGAGLDFGAVCDTTKIAELEAAARGWGVNRRIAFVLAAKSRSELVQVVHGLAASDEEVLIEILDGIRGLIEHYQSCIELFSAVEARLFVAAHEAFDVPFD